MDKKEIQKQRIMGYFIDAAKEIINEEGIQSVTARKVGEKAGYSYATIYNYFNDLKTLLSYVAFDAMEDCYKYMISFKNDKEDCREQMISYSSAYFTYFAKNPDMFQLIFLEELGNIPGDIIKKGKQPSISGLLRESLIKCAKEGYVEEEKLTMLQELISSSLRGKLLFLLKGRNPQSLDEVIISLRKEMEFLLKI